LGRQPDRGRRTSTLAQVAKGRVKPSLLFFVRRAHVAAALLAAVKSATYVGCTQVQPVTEPSQPSGSDPFEPDPFGPDATGPKPSEPIFNVPPVIIATVAALVGVHLCRMFVLSDSQDEQFVLTFAFVPARYFGDAASSASFPGGFGADLWTFFTYAFLHADLLHIGLNLAWLIPFGTAVARRFGAWRYVVFMLVAAAAGALAQLASDPGSEVPMIGASAAISGAMAAAMRFIFQAHGPLETWRDGPRNGEAYRVPALSLVATFRDPRLLLFLAVWMGLNALFGLGAVSFGEQGQQIAWQAHIGGFLAGLLLFGAFDPVTTRGQLDTEPTG
jgi:membrane associated rhomboid family serine protease